MARRALGLRQQRAGGCAKPRGAPRCGLQLACLCLPSAPSGASRTPARAANIWSLRLPAGTGRGRRKQRKQPSPIPACSGSATTAAAMLLPNTRANGKLRGEGKRRRREASRGDSGVQGILFCAGCAVQGICKQMDPPLCRTKGCAAWWGRKVCP